MKKLVVTEFMTLDGVMEAPHEWSFPYWNDEIAEFKNNELFESDTTLLGRITYQGFADAWPERTGDYADRLNSFPKYVASTTLENPEWNNSHVIGENVAEEVRRLKQQDGQNILVHGSRTLVQTLIQNDLVDEFHLLVYPLVLGKGLRLFSGEVQSNLSLAENRPFSSGVVLLRYQREEAGSDV